MEPLKNPKLMRNLLFVVLLLCSNPALSKCYEDFDTFEKSELYRCGAWEVGGALKGIDLIPYLLNKNGSTELFVRLRLNQEEFSNIKRDGRILFETDDNREFTLYDTSQVGKNGKSDEPGGSYANEFSDYIVSLEQILAISSSKYVDLTIYTTKSKIERKLEMAQLENYREFVNFVIQRNLHLQDAD